jgi:hypothetical protein
LAKDDFKHPLIAYASERMLDEHRADLIATWWRESGFRPDALNTGNKNGTSDHGICQLNSAYHLPFINSADFSDPYKQIDYCISVYHDALKKKRHLGSVWYGWQHKHKYIPDLINYDF